MEAGQVSDPRVRVFTCTDVISYNPGNADRPQRIQVCYEFVKKCFSVEDLPSVEENLRKAEKLAMRIHKRRYVEYLRDVPKSVPVIPETFYVRDAFNYADARRSTPSPLRHHARPEHAGYWIFDSDTPLMEDTYETALMSLLCAHSAAEWAFRRGCGAIAYSLGRSPGHNASYSVGGGYCLFNNAFTAACTLCEQWKEEAGIGPIKYIVIVDLDFHHGNGTWSLVQKHGDLPIKCVNIYADNDLGYEPYFIEYCIRNHENVDLDFKALDFPIDPQAPNAREEAELFLKKTFMVLSGLLGERDMLGGVVVSLGLDMHILDDLTGGVLGVDESWYHQAGKTIREAVEGKCPVVVVQEGGYDPWSARRCVEAFFRGLAPAPGDSDKGVVAARI